MPGWDDLDETLIVMDEYASTALDQVLRWSRGEPLATSTALQRALGLDVVRAWSRVRLEAMRERVRD